jgi:hypothetical protein
MDGGERDETTQNTQPQAMLTTAIARANPYRGVVNVPGYESKANMSIRKANAAEEVRPSTSTRRRTTESMGQLQIGMMHTRPRHSDSYTQSNAG